MLLVSCFSWNHNQQRVKEAVSRGDRETASWLRPVSRQPSGTPRCCWSLRFTQTHDRVAVSSSASWQEDRSVRFSITVTLFSQSEDYIKVESINDAIALIVTNIYFIQLVCFSLALWHRLFVVAADWIAMHPVFFNYLCKSCLINDVCHRRTAVSFLLSKAQTGVEYWRKFKFIHVKLHSHNVCRTNSLSDQVDSGLGKVN